MSNTVHVSERNKKFREINGKEDLQLAKDKNCEIINSGGLGPYLSERNEKVT